MAQVSVCGGWVVPSAAPRAVPVPLAGPVAAVPSGLVAAPPLAGPPAPVASPAGVPAPGGLAAYGVAPPRAAPAPAALLAPLAAAPGNRAVPGLLLKPAAAAPCGPLRSPPLPWVPSCEETRRACSTAGDPPVPPDRPRSAPIATAPPIAVVRESLPPVEDSAAPVVQVKNFISTGSASRDMSTIANPVSRVLELPPEPIMVNAVAYTAAAAGL